MTEFDGIVDDQWLFSALDVQMYIAKPKRDNDKRLLVFDLTFKFMNEKDIRPDGKVYLETKRTTKIGK